MLEPSPGRQPVFPHIACHHLKFFFVPNNLTLNPPLVDRQADVDYPSSIIIEEE